jgi:hypothetical protein
VPAAGVLEIETKPTGTQLLYDELGENSYGAAEGNEVKQGAVSDSEKDKIIKELEKKLIQQRLKEVEKQQDEFQAR